MSCVGRNPLFTHNADFDKTSEHFGLIRIEVLQIRSADGFLQARRQFSVVTCPGRLACPCSGRVVSGGR